MLAYKKKEKRLHCFWQNKYFYNGFEGVDWTLRLLSIILLILLIIIIITSTCFL